MYSGVVPLCVQKMHIFLCLSATHIALFNECLWSGGGRFVHSNPIRVREGNSPDIDR